MSQGATSLVLEAPEPGAGRASGGSSNTSAQHESWSQRLWGVDWQQILPFEVDDIRVTREAFADGADFIEAVFPKTFNVARQWHREPMSVAKRRFAEEMDIFVFRHAEKVIGVLAGHPSDWSTYYWRAIALLPEYRGRSVLTSFANVANEPLRAAGVQRVEVDTSPANRAMVRLLGGQGFIVTSTGSSERWGLSLRFTKFLDEDAERIYVTQFLDVPKTSHSERSRP